ncbi:NAD(P)/FAD-dependent oxidoreductase [Actinospica robiniae]|uniref:NAD(P)-binding protein n=1 Tax=Actinospica robiniae TaxID=304901 RepID=UPI00040088B0|nr:NAD(P)/FAD-dependent oxidoreductase [Actinospica robiniae]
MRATRRQAIKTLAGAGAAAGIGVFDPAAAHAAQDPAAGTSGARRVIERDVVVIGGGSAGTYTAVRLTDLGKSVVVVEHKGRLGGHCETYTDPATGLTTDIGVVVFHDLPVVRDYFSRFGVDLTVGSAGGGSTPAFADFRTGEVVAGWTPPDPTAALQAYYGILQKYPYLAGTYDLPNPVPAELLTPWGEFAAANGLGGLMTILSDYAQGFAHLLRMPTVYILKYFGLSVVGSLFTGDFLSTPNHDNSALYEAATAFLGEDVLLETNVLSGTRGPGGVEFAAVGPHGPVTIRAEKAVITVPPMPALLAPFDPSPSELALFSRFRQGNYCTGLIRLPGAPDSTAVQNIGADTLYNLPPLPALYAVTPSSVPGLFDLKFGSDVPLSDVQVHSVIQESLGRLQAAGTIPATTPVFVDYSNHSPYELTVSAADVAGGFYSRLYGLQGRRNTFWNGAAFAGHDSSLIWQYAESLLPQIAE